MEWLLPGHVPERIEIGWEVRAPTRTVTDRGRWVGYRPAGDGKVLIDFLVHPAGDAFLFTPTGSVLTFPYSDLSPVVGPLLGFGSGNVWGTTWPDEVPFWRSPEGSLFLAMQLAIQELRMTTEIPRRIAVLPDGLAREDLLAFAVEMEAQALLGIDIRVFEWDDARAQLGMVDVDAVLRLGQHLSVSYRLGAAGTGSEPTASVELAPERVASMEELYCEVQPRGIGWPAFLDQMEPERTRRVRAAARDRARGVRAAAAGLVRHGAPGADPLRLATARADGTPA
ncbi:MAG TPA: hypothetical protein VEW93_04455 [Acidimicrobiales bacterium]|nr:hypothetical protein [Acidimicrobiales bacterium]